MPNHPTVTIRTFSSPQTTPHLQPPPWAAPAPPVSGSPGCCSPRSPSCAVCPGLGPCPSQGAGSPGAGVGLLARPCKQVPGWKALVVASWPLHSAVTYQACSLGGRACCLCSGLCRWRWTRAMGLGRGLAVGDSAAPCVRRQRLWALEHLNTHPQVSPARS